MNARYFVIQVTNRGKVFYLKECENFKRLLLVNRKLEEECADAHGECEVEFFLCKVCVSEAHSFYRFKCVDKLKIKRVIEQCLNA